LGLHQVAANYTVVETLARDFPPSDPDFHGRANPGWLASRLGCEGPEELSRPDLGVAVKTSRSSWVRRVDIDARTYFIKTYVYRTAFDRCRGALRNTGPWRPSRARREAEALAWMADHGFPAPAVLGALERRSFGFVTKAVLVTEAWPGEPLDRVLGPLAATERQAVAAALGRFVARLHQRGFRDRNLDVRNVLARRPTAADLPVELAKIDSPRFVLVPAGRSSDRLARADWARLLPQLEPFGLVSTVQAAARAAAVDGPT
jgi:Phosphotransferase enzyme family